LRCERRRYGCQVSAQMALHDNSPITISSAHIHNHTPTPRYLIGLRQFMNRLRERGATENIVPHIIVDQEAHM